MEYQCYHTQRVIAATSRHILVFSLATKECVTIIKSGFTSCQGTIGSLCTCSVC